MDAIQVFKAGYPNRMSFQLFVTKYSAFIAVTGINSLTKDFYDCFQIAKQTANEFCWRAASNKLIDIVPIVHVMMILLQETDQNINLSNNVDIIRGLQLGNNQIFMKAELFELLEFLYSRVISFIARRLQRKCKASLLANHKSVSYAAALQAVTYFSDHKRRKIRQLVSATILIQVIYYLDPRYILFLISIIFSLIFMFFYFNFTLYACFPLYFIA